MVLSSSDLICSLQIYFIDSSRLFLRKMYVHLVKNTAYSKTIIRKKFIENSPKQFRWYLGRVTTSLNHQVRLRHFFASYQTSHRHHQMSWWVLQVICRYYFRPKTSHCCQNRQKFSRALHTREHHL